MSIAALPRDIGGGGGGEKVVVQSRIGCNAAVVTRCVASDDVGETTSSSIGKESESGEESTSQCQDDTDEVQSSYKGPLCALNALEESLPIRHGISRFYRGKSKSFTNLRASLTTSSSCTDLAKADNPYAKKRKNALAFSLMYQQTYQKPTSCGQILLAGINTESNEDVSESKRQKQLDEPTMDKQKW